jgi:hypothetical protein
MGNARWHGATMHQLAGGMFTIYHLLLKVRRKPK